MMQLVSGVYAAAVTPHRNGGQEADIGAALELVDFLSTAGVQGIVLLGSTGEFLHLTFDDRTRLINLVVKRSQVPILAGVSHSTLDGALHLAREAISAGAAGLLLMPPYFFRYAQEEVKEFYLQFANQIRSEIPLFLYNIPQFTNEIAVETAGELLATGRFAGLKDSSGRLEYFGKLQSLRGAQRFQFFVGNDALFTRVRQAGAHGLVSGVACAAPELLVRLDQAIQTRAQPQIERLDSQLQEFLKWHDQFPTPVIVKVATSLRGLTIGALAAPLSPAKQKLLEEFCEWFPGWLKLVKS